jgi:diacylglycerol kinase (ATP)
LDSVSYRDVYGYDRNDCVESAWRPGSMDVMIRSALFLVNRKSRQGRRSSEDVRQALTSGGLQLVDADVDKAADLSRVIRQHRGQVDLVILGGGDGTIHHALEGLAETQLPAGIIPLGTANDLARTLNLPTDPLAACDVILQGKTTAIDLGKVNDKLFCNVASIGLAVQVTQRLKRETKSRWGVFAYMIAALQSLWQSRPFYVEIQGATQTHSKRTIQVTVGNGRSYGGGLTVDEAATINDGVLHLYSLEFRRWWQIIPLIPALWRGTLRDASQVFTLRGDQFEVHTPGRNKTIVADGELAGATPAHFEVLPEALNVFVPAPTEVRTSE